MDGEYCIRDVEEMAGTSVWYEEGVLATVVVELIVATVKVTIG